MGRREENKQRTRQALIDAGLALFRRKGFDETRVQDIVEQAGVSPATFFNYFPSKDALLEARASEASDLYAALLRHEVARDDATVRERLVEITKLFAATMQQDIAISRLMATRTALFFGSTGDKAAKDRESQALLAQLFAQGQATGEIDPAADPMQLAELYTAGGTLTATNWLTEWFGKTKQTLEERMLRGLALLLDGAVKPRN